MRPSFRVLLVGALAAGLAAPTTAVQAQASAAKGSYVVGRAGAGPQAVAYMTRESDFIAGRTVHLRSTKTIVGTIEKVDESHAFPPSFPKSPAKAVLIRRKDRSKSWVPVEGITKIYVVTR